MKPSEELEKHFNEHTEELKHWKKQSQHIKDLCKMFYMQGASDYQDICIGKGGSKSAS